MARYLDLSAIYKPTSDTRVLGKVFQDAYGRRPELIDGRRCLVEPAEGFQPEPLLRLGRLLELSDSEEVARSLDRVLSGRLWEGAASPEIPKVDPGFGMISELGQHLRDAFSAKPGEQLIKVLSEQTIPYFRGLGATHVCALRPNHVAQQSRISLMKLLWLSSDLGLSEAKKRILDDRALEAILPESQSITQWIEPLICHFPYHFAIPVNLMGGYLFFFARGPWLFPREASLGLSGIFLQDPKTAATDELVSPPMQVPRVPHRHGYDVVRLAVEAVNNASWFATNLMNFSVEGKFDARRQTLFLSALELLIGDIKGMTSSFSNFSKASFCFSALDKLANIVAGLLGKPDKEVPLFRALFSIKAIRRMHRAIGTSPRITDSFQRRLLQMQLLAVLQVQREIKKQLKDDTGEESRLSWLRSLRNLRHGAFLNKDQFSKLFVESPGQVPSHIARATLGLVLVMMTLPEEFLAVFAVADL